MGTNCDIKKCVVPIIAVAVVYFGLDMLVWHVILGGMLQENAALWRPMPDIESRRWVAYAGYIVFAALFNWIYWKGLEAGKCPRMQGIKFGSVIGLLMWGAGMMLEYPFVPWPDKLYIASSLLGIVEYAILGFVAGLLCKCCEDKAGNGGRCCS